MKNVESENESIVLSIIIVSFNCKFLLKACLNSIFKQTAPFSFEIIIIDNNSSDGTIEILKRDFEDAILIQNEKNIGFAAANNLGIKIAKGQYILLLNPDTIILNCALLNAIQFMQNNLNIGILGAKLLNKDGSLQRDCIMSYPSILSVFSESFFLYKIFSKSSLWGKLYLSHIDHDQVQYVDVVKGAFLLIRQRTIEQIGLLDEQFFIYSEEIDWCYRARKTGWNICYQPGVEVIHLEGQSTKQQKIKMFIELHKTKNLFLDKHYPKAKASIIKVLYAMGVFLRASIWGVTTVFVFFRKDQFIYCSNRFKIYLHASLWYLGLLR